MVWVSKDSKKFPRQGGPNLKNLHGYSPDELFDTKLDSNSFLNETKRLIDSNTFEIEDRNIKRVRRKSCNNDISVYIFLLSHVFMCTRKKRNSAIHIQNEYFQ